jgi:dihydrolipoamide dehydrogenase
MLLKKNKVTVVGGEARLVAPDELSVTVDGTEHRMKAKAIIVATGGKPIEIPGFQIDGENIISSREALELTEGPKRLAVIGGGFIGLEIGTFYLKTGSELTVIELLPQLLPGADPDLVKVVQRGLKKRKAKIHLESQAKGWEKTDDGVVLDCISKDKEFKVTVDKVLLSVGVRPNSQGLGLEDLGIEMDRRGHIVVDKKLQTNVPGVYAIGDVTPGYYLAHRASKEAIVAAEIIAGKDVELDYRCLPAAVFTDPEIGSVGMTEPQAREAGHDVKIGRFPFAASGRALAAGETEGFAKVITDAKDGLILGVQIVGMEASNLIAEAALAIEAGITAEDLALTIHAHPTLPEAIMEAAEASIGKAIHVLQ